MSSLILYLVDKAQITSSSDVALMYFRGKTKGIYVLKMGYIKETQWK